MAASFLVFVSKIRRTGSAPAQITSAGQVCTETICKKVDVVIALPLRATVKAAAPSNVDLKTLVQVR